MKKKLFAIVVVLITFFGMNTNAQELALPSYTFSHQKPAYFTLKDGSKIEATVTDIDRKKGQIKLIKIKDADDKKMKLLPTDIQSMYLPQSGLSKLSQLNSMTNDVTKWKRASVDDEMLQKGYIYFESTDVKMGKKTRTLMMQVLNPTFCNYIKIYNDPYADETASVGIGGMTLAGGDAKSYYFKKDDGAAIYLTKKDYKKNFSEVWSDCPVLIERYGKSPKWTDLAKHVFEFSNECK